MIAILLVLLARGVNCTAGVVIIDLLKSTDLFKARALLAHTQILVIVGQKLVQSCSDLGDPILGKEIGKGWILLRLRGIGDGKQGKILLGIR